MAEKPVKLYEESSRVRVKGSEDAINMINKLREEAQRDPEGFWEKEAESLSWFKRWEKVLEWNPPFARWFTGGMINASYNAVDKQRRDKMAIIWIGEDGARREIKYSDLYREVNRLASGMKRIGIRKGDRVTIYMPMIPELPIAMLACARLGATHSVVFSGFSAEALADRINDSGSRLLITADGGYRRGKVIKLKEIADQALERCQSIEHVIIFKRLNTEINIRDKDILWDSIPYEECPPEPLESTHPLFILYTSGTTGKPKGIVHGTGGYLTYVYSTMKWIFDLKEDDIYWCTADIGWVTGHTYIVYGPLMHGATLLIYEGAPDYPKPDIWWEIIEKNKVTVFYTTPTALRMFMRLGDDLINAHDLNSLRLLGTVGEPINPEVWLWYYKTIGKERAPIIDTWWQTETGAALISPTSIALVPLKPGSATFPLPGIDAAIVDENGREVSANTKGYLVIRKPWPGMMLTIWRDDERYKTYWSKFSYYYSGDYAMIDEDKYFWLLGRADDVLKVAGHRLGTMELESALVSHKAVAEAAVGGKVHEIKGESISAFLVLKAGYDGDDKLKEEIKAHIRNTVGAIAIPDELYFVKRLPKTRSGKIMRRLLRAIINNAEIGDISTLEDGAAVEDVKAAYEELKKTIGK